MAKRRPIKSKVKAVIDGYRAAGLDVRHVVVVVSADEEVKVFPGKPGDDVVAFDDLDKWIDKHARAVERH